MQIVIDIPDEVYKVLTETAIIVTEVYPSTIERALAEGIVLPKGHGRLVDVDKMIDDFKGSKLISLAERFKIANIVEHQQTIVDADKEVEECR